MTTAGPLGQIERNRGRTTLRFARSLPRRPDHVWRVLTESDHMRWWMPVDMVGERATGATVHLVFWPDLVEEKGLDPDAGTATIQVWDPPSVFEWIWHGTPIRFATEAVDDGCRLRLTVEIETDDPETIADNAGGYHLWMDHLVRLVVTGSSRPIAEADSGPLHATYLASLRDGSPS